MQSILKLSIIGYTNSKNKNKKRAYINIYSKKRISVSTLVGKYRLPYFI